jgi:hypothetical protein
VYRTRWTFPLAFATFVLAATGFALAAAFARNTKGHIAWGITAASMVLFWLAVRRIGVWIEADGIAVVNLLRRRRFRWVDIERFQLAPAGIYPFAGHTILKSGRDIPLGAITVPRIFTARLKRYAQEPIDELNALLREARQSSGTAPASAR